MTPESFELIKNTYGQVASWAIWGEAGEKPKSNVGDMSIFDLTANPRLLSQIHSNYILVALNFSTDVQFASPFMNFHSASPHANDYMLRYAFKNTAVYGGYMTDLIKNLPTKSSKDVIALLKSNPKLVDENIQFFREELRLLGAGRPTIIALGSDVYRMLKLHLIREEYTSLIKVTHYSHQMSKEDYRREVVSAIQTDGVCSVSGLDYLLGMEALLTRLQAKINDVHWADSLEEAAISARALAKLQLLSETLGARRVRHRSER